MVAIPLLAHERVIGALVLTDHTGREFTPDELQALQAFADQAALALENARLYATAQDSLTRLRDTQAQLVQAAKMSALGQLVSGVAHELNNPLSVIIGYGQLLLTREVPQPMRRPVELMVAQGDRMAKIVRNLLFFARQRPPERAAVRLQTVIEQTLALRINQLTLSGITVETEFAPDLPEITGDAQQLEQVFLNLLLNAEQAILEVRPQGRIMIRTRMRADNAAICAEVVDDGPGMPVEAQSRIFEPFFTTKSPGSGTGLGLSVSYGIIEEHGGRLSVQSRPGETIFTLELPATRPPAHVERAPRPVAAPSGTGPSGPGGGGRAARARPDRHAAEGAGVEGGRRPGRPHRAAVRQAAPLRSDHLGHQDAGRRWPDVLPRRQAHDAALARRFIFITGDTANPEAWAFLEDSHVPVIEKPFPPAVFEEAVARVMAAARPDALALISRAHARREQGRARRDSRGRRVGLEERRGPRAGAFLEGIRDGLSSGGSVTISGFGTFVVAKRVSRAGRNPRTGRAITIPSSRVPRFRASRALKAAIR